MNEPFNYVKDDQPSLMQIYHAVGDLVMKLDRQKYELDELRKFVNREYRQNLEAIKSQITHLRNQPIVSPGDIAALSTQVEKMMKAVEMAEQKEEGNSASILNQNAIRDIRKNAAEKQRQFIQEEVLRQLPDLRDVAKGIIADQSKMVATQATDKMMKGGSDFAPVRDMIKEVIGRMIAEEARAVGFGDEESPLGTYLVDCAKREIAEYVSKNMMINFNTNDKGGW